MKTIQAPRILAAIVAAAAFSVASVASPALADDAPPAEVKLIVERAFSGKLTDADREVLINDYPEIAAVVPDYSQTETEEVVTKALSPTVAGKGATVAATTKCSTYSGWSRFKSVLGFTIYKFTHSAKVCSNGSKVTSHSSPTYTVSEADYTVDNWSVVDKSVTGVNTAKSTSRIQVKIQQCVIKVGCYGNNYPTGTIVGKANSTADISTTVR